MNNIYLVGMMGAGKSATGKILAERLGLRVIETDEFIIEASGKTIPDIFKDQGEETFRKMESDVLGDVSKWDHTVVATGGGIVTHEQNTPLMKNTGIMVYLRTTPENLWKRIENEPCRPLLQVNNPPARVGELLKARSALYEQANFTVCTDQKKPDVVAEEIEQYVKTK